MLANPGRWGDWKELKAAKRGDRGLDWPYSADGHSSSIRLCDDSMKAVSILAGGLSISVGNKEWVCVIDGRSFVYHHDGEDRFITLADK